MIEILRQNYTRCDTCNRYVKYCIHIIPKGARDWYEEHINWIRKINRITQKSEIISIEML